MSTHDEIVDSDPYNFQSQDLWGVEGTDFKVFRQSNLGTADTCLKRLEFELDPDIPGGCGTGRAVGTAYHAGLAHYYRSIQADAEWVERSSFADRMPEITAEAYAAFDAEAEVENFRWDEDAEHSKDKIFNLLNTYFTDEHQWPYDYRVVAVEHTFLMPLFNDWVARGTVDLVLEQISTGWHIIVDHKTANKPWQKGRESHRKTNQPAWYSHFWKLLNPEVPGVGFCYDIMAYNLKFERRQVEVSQAMIDGVLQKAELVTGLVDKGGPYPPNTQSWLCSAKWCDFWSICPFGEVFQ